MGINHPLVSIIIVSFNACQYLEDCLEAILANKYPNYEVIIVDNGSRDGTKKLLEKKYKKEKNIKSVFLKENKGPAYARNIGAKLAKGKYLALLDNDTKPDKEWLVVATKEFEKDSTIGAIQCKLVLMDEPEKIDYIGDYFTKLGFLAQIVWAGDLEVNTPKDIREIFSAKSAGMVIRNDVFSKSGALDNDYFIYVEETDLCWRVWLSGYRVVYIPNSIVYHKFGTTYRLFPKYQIYLLRFHGTKNYILTLLKNLEIGNLLRILPIHLTLWIIVAIYQIITFKLKSGLYIFSGIVWNIIHIKDTLKKRRKIQHIRKINDNYLFSKVLRTYGIGYFLRKFLYKSKVSGIKTLND